MAITNEGALIPKAEMPKTQRSINEPVTQDNANPMDKPKIRAKSMAVQASKSVAGRADLMDSTTERSVIKERPKSAPFQPNSPSFTWTGQRPTRNAT